MRISVYARLRTFCLLVLGAALVVFFVTGDPANANTVIRNAWVDLYGLTPSDADCQLCHRDSQAPSWNGYGWDIRTAIGDLACDGADGSAPDGSVSLDEIFVCIEGLDSDMDPGSFSNINEIMMDTQPGWTAADTNTVYTESSTDLNQPPAPGLEPYDPTGAGGAGGMGGMGGAGGTGCPLPATGPFEPFGDGILVKQGQSIQEAIDLAEEGTQINIEPGVYEEPCNPGNGLNVTKNGIQLIGLSTAAAGPKSPDEERVIVRSTGTQTNGIVIVPLEVSQEAQPKGREVERTDCMGCHTSMAPPFPLHPDVPKVIPKQDDPWLFDITIQGITIEGFENNGLFTEHVDGFEFIDVESINNRNYGIFPTLSRRGSILNSYSTGSDKDSALWVETSESVDVLDNVVENSVNGIEVSNSDDVLVMGNVSQNNTVGAAILLLPDIFDNRGSAKRIDLVDNEFNNNNKINTASPGSILGSIPRGIGILYVGVDDSLISGNLVEDNDFVGIGIIDYCLALAGTAFDCDAPPPTPEDPPPVSPEFKADATAENNRIVGNTLVNNGTNPDPSDFDDFAADLTLLTLPDHNNCFADNVFTTSFSLLQVGLPPCPDEPGTGGAGGMGGAGGAGGMGGTDTGDGGGGCAVGSAAASRTPTTWLALLCCALALSLRRRARRR
ncbi:MAG: hypothetical protein OEM15_13460 [Myxococcales bacterium]|nr:hypothetical protein [Myxococcales bacterium]MDH3486160.1 hypothetical protein [Myxococcales bacterium]